MKRMLTPRVTPPGGWRYVDPDTQFYYGRHYRSLDELLDHVRTYRAQNKHDPISDLRLVVEDWLCCQPAVGRYCKEEPSPAGRTIGHYAQGAKAAVEIAVSKAAASVGIANGPFVSLAVAEKRAAICVRCHYNEENESHSRLSRYTDTYVAGIVGNRKTSADGELLSCTICTCALRPKVHISDSIIKSTMKSSDKPRFPNGSLGKDEKPLHCWQVRPIKENDNAE